VDVAVRIGTLPDSLLTATPLGAIRRVVCASPDYLARHPAPTHPNDLAGHTCITFEALGSAGAWPFIVDGREVSVPVHSRLAVNTAEAAIDAAISGVGLTRVLCYQVDDALRAGRLEIVLPDYPSASMAVNLVHAGQQRLALKLRTFLDFAAPRLRQRLGRLSTRYPDH
jgi:DNA-binding transcriptional LysR family regulator